MKRFIYIFITVFIITLFPSCEELNLQPISSTSLMEDDVYSTYEGYMGMFAKCYATFVLEGQGDGDSDISGAGVKENSFEHYIICKNALQMKFYSIHQVVMVPGQ